MTTLFERDQRVIWHPFTQHQMTPEALPIVRGEGAYLYDADGRGYLDLVSSWWVNIHGHAQPEIARAIYEQALRLEHVIFAGFTHEPAIALAEKLLALLPSGFSKVFYSDNGSTAVEVALKMAHQYWGNQNERRTRFLAFSGGYHGDTFGAMSVGQSSQFYQSFKDLLFSVDFAPFPDTWQGDADCLVKESASLRWVEEYLSRHGDETAALIIEPLLQGSYGMRTCRPEFLRDLEKLLRRYDVLTIYDEVLTGFGRTGANFACEKAGTTPDIICLAKGLTGGFLPLSVTVCQERVYQAFLGDHMDQALIHGHSYTANPLGCAAALASMALLCEDSTQEQIRAIEATHHERMAELANLAGVEKTRICGTLAAFDLASGGAYGTLSSQQWRSLFMERGLIIRPLGKTVYLLPPYCVSETELNDAYRVITEVLEKHILPTLVE